VPIDSVTKFGAKLVSVTLSPPHVGLGLLYQPYGLAPPASASVTVAKLNPPVRRRTARANNAAFNITLRSKIDVSTVTQLSLFRNWIKARAAKLVDFSHGDCAKTRRDQGTSG
jgi:hypothetical protein